jgi:hypothetical protein
MDQAALNGLVDDGDSALIGSASCLSIAAFNGGDGLFECSSERGPLASIPLAVSLRLTSAFFCLACVSHDSLILKLGRHGGRYSGQYGESVLAQRWVSAERVRRLAANALCLQSVFRRV